MNLYAIYIISFVSGFNWHVKLLKSLPKVWSRCGCNHTSCLQKARRTRESARKDLLIWSYGFVLRFIVAGVLLLLITNVFGIKMTSVWSLLIGGGLFVVVVSLINIRLSTPEGVAFNVWAALWSVLLVIWLIIVVIYVLNCWLGFFQWTVSHL